VNSRDPFASDWYTLSDIEPDLGAASPNISAGAFVATVNGTAYIPRYDPPSPPPSPLGGKQRAVPSSPLGERKAGDKPGLQVSHLHEKYSRERRGERSAVERI